MRTSGKVVALLETIWRRGRFGPRPARPIGPAYLRRPRRRGKTMTITDPLTAEVADLHGMARDIQSA
jgi:hypothetical protein